MHHLAVAQVVGVNHLNLGQLNALMPLGQLYISILARHGVVIGFQGWSSRTEEDGGSPLQPPPTGGGYCRNLLQLGEEGGLDSLFDLSR